MTYGFRPENWPAFQAELHKRGIRAADIEKVEMLPTEDPGVPLEARHGLGEITGTLRSGRAESRSQLGLPPRTPPPRPPDRRRHLARNGVCGGVWAVDHILGCRAGSAPPCPAELAETSSTSRWKVRPPSNVLAWRGYG